jgi:hypothetical protein
MEAVCQAGLGGDVGWLTPGLFLWQSAQLGLVWTGMWQFLQWSFRGAFQPAPCEIGAVTLWQAVQ